MSFQKPVVAIWLHYTKIFPGNFPLSGVEIIQALLFISYLKMVTDPAFKVLFKTLELFSEHSAWYLLLLVPCLVYFSMQKIDTTDSSKM